MVLVKFRAMNKPQTMDSNKNTALLIRYSTFHNTLLGGRSMSPSLLTKYHDLGSEVNVINPSTETLEVIKAMFIGGASLPVPSAQNICGVKTIFSGAEG
jgi:hypothetical protein